MTLESVNLNELSFDELSKMDLTERFINKLHPKRRLEFCISKIKNKDRLSSVSEREDALVLLGELYYKLHKEQEGIEFTTKEKEDICSQIKDAFDWAMDNEPNCVPHHEICYQISQRDIRELIPKMVQIALHHKSVVSRHEYIECLANIGAWDEIDSMLPMVLNDENADVRETAKYCEDRLRRYRNEPNLGFIDIL